MKGVEYIVSFMFNPYPYEDISAINRPELDNETINSVSCGMTETITSITRLISEKLIQYEAGQGKSQGKSIEQCVLAIDGYPGVEFGLFIERLKEHIERIGVKPDFKSFNMSSLFRESSVLEQELKEYLPEDRDKDPVLLYGQLYEKGYEGLFDKEKLLELEKVLENFKVNGTKIFVVYGCGALTERLRSYYDISLYIDLIPLKAVLKARKENYKNLGDNHVRPLKEKLRRCYYVDFVSLTA